MTTRFTRIVDWFFCRPSRSAGELSANAPRAFPRARPRVDDRARYDSGTAFFGS